MASRELAVAGQFALAAHWPRLHRPARLGPAFKGLNLKADGAQVLPRRPSGLLGLSATFRRDVQESYGVALYAPSSSFPSSSSSTSPDSYRRSRFRMAVARKGLHR